MNLKYLKLIITVGALLFFAGCSNDGGAKKPGESIDDAIEDAADAIEDAADGVKDASN